jgi:hypothetical protein
MQAALSGGIVRSNIRLWAVGANAVRSGKIALSL